MLKAQRITLAEYFDDDGKSNEYRLLVHSGDSDTDTTPTRLRFVPPNRKAYTANCISINMFRTEKYWISNYVSQPPDQFLETVRGLYPELYDWLLFHPEWL